MLEMCAAAGRAAQADTLAALALSLARSSVPVIIPHRRRPWTYMAAPPSASVRPPLPSLPLSFARPLTRPPARARQKANIHVAL